METLAALLVGQPRNIVVVALAFAAAWQIARILDGGAQHRRGALLVAALAWGVYAAWEWLVQARTPEANIRVDLMLVWPVLAVISAWAVVRGLRSR